MDNHKKDLINKYLSGGISPEEFWEVEKLLEEDSEFLRRFEITKGLRKIERDILKKNLNKEIEANMLLIEKKRNNIFSQPKVLVGLAAGLILIAGIAYYLLQDSSPVLLTTLSATEKVDVVSNNGKDFADGDSTGVVGKVVVQLFQDKNLPTDTTKYVYIRDMDIPEADTLKIYFPEKQQREVWENAKELTIKYNEKEEKYNLLIDKKKYILNVNTLEILK